MLDDKKVHAAFEASLVLKGLFAVAEIVSAAAVFVVPPRLMLDLVRAVTQAELSEDPRDLVANALLRAAHHLSVGGEHFAAAYLFVHGIVKLWLIGGLWRERIGYYPIAIAVFGAFIAYQIDRYRFTHSPLLLFITAVDAVVIWLTWLEYRCLRARARAAVPPDSEPAGRNGGGGHGD